MFCKRWHGLGREWVSTGKPTTLLLQRNIQSNSAPISEFFEFDEIAEPFVYLVGHLERNFPPPNPEATYIGTQCHVTSKYDNISGVVAMPCCEPAQTFSCRYCHYSWTARSGSRVPDSPGRSPQNPAPCSRSVTSRSGDPWRYLSCDILESN